MKASMENDYFLIDNMKNIEEWFSEYGESHQNPTNKLVHWFCVPVIFFCVVALLSLLQLPSLFGLNLNFAHAVLLFAAFFYLRLSLNLGLITLLFASLCLWLSMTMQGLGLPVFTIAVGLFIAAWIGQFWGHHIEGKKPSFLKDIQFLLIGPLWLMGFIFKGIGIKY